MSRQNEELEASNGQLKANEKVIMNEQVSQQSRSGQHCDISGINRMLLAAYCHKQAMLL